MSDIWGDRFGEAERALLAPFVTDLDAPIFGLRNLPEVVKGALFSRYSRTDKSLRRILLDEFIQAPESGFAAIVGGAAATGVEQIVAVRQAEAFYERVLIGYGDDSVAELGGAHVACEGISNIAAKAPPTTTAVRSVSLMTLHLTQAPSLILPTSWSFGAAALCRWLQG